MLTLAEAAEQIRTGKLSPVELTRACLQRIEQLNPVLNAFITVTGDVAMDQARKAEAEISASKYRGPLHGIPIALKDLFDTAGTPTTAASNQYRHRVPTQDAYVVQRLKESGAVILGKTNMHEFAFGMTGAVSAFGPTLNPWDRERISGGSSSGSAAAVAAGMCVAALGSDTSGSGRCPPALCGVVGLRPSAGVFSLEGTVPLCSSFDTVSPIAACVRDIFLISSAIAAQQPSTFDPSGLAASHNVSHLRVGVARAYFFDDLHPDVAQAIDEALKLLSGVVADVREVDVPVQNFRTIFDAEIWKYHEAMMEKTPELYQPATLARLKNCRGISATDYIRTKRELDAFRARAESVFEQVDVVITPTTPVPAPKLAELEALPLDDVRPFEMKYLMRNTLPFSSLFWPSVSVPCGFTRDRLPVGMQITSRPHADCVALHLALVYEEAAGWRKQMSAVSSQP